MFFSSYPPQCLSYPYFIAFIPCEPMNFGFNQPKDEIKFTTEEKSSQFHQNPSITEQSLTEDLGKQAKTDKDSVLPEIPADSQTDQQERQKLAKYLELNRRPLHNAMRNIQPNIIHQIICFIQKQKRSGKVVKKYLSNCAIEPGKKFSVDRFYCYQKLIKEKINRYLNMNSLKELCRLQEPKCQIYSQEEQQNFILMNRILVKYFLQHQFENINEVGNQDMESVAQERNLVVLSRYIFSVLNAYDLNKLLCLKKLKIN